MNEFLTILIVLGFVGALASVVLYAIPEKGRLPWHKSELGRFIMADSGVLMLIYASGLLNRLVPTWHLATLFRVILSVIAVSVVLWRVSFIVRANYKKNKEKS